MEGVLKTFDLTPFDIQMILVCVVLFVIFMKVMERVFAKPLLALSERREAATTGAHDHAHVLEEQAHTLLNQYEDAVSQARVEAMKERIAVVDKAKRDAASIVHSAEQQAAAEMNRAKQELAGKLDSLRERVMNDAEGLAQSIVQTLSVPRKQREAND